MKTLGLFSMDDSILSRTFSSSVCFVPCSTSLDGAASLGSFFLSYVMVSSSGAFNGTVDDESFAFSLGPSLCSSDASLLPTSSVAFSAIEKCYELVF